MGVKQAAGRGIRTVQEVRRVEVVAEDIRARMQIMKGAPVD